MLIYSVLLKKYEKDKSRAKVLIFVMADGLYRLVAEGEILLKTFLLAASCFSPSVYH